MEGKEKKKDLRDGVRVLSGYNPCGMEEKPARFRIVWTESSIARLSFFLVNQHTHKVC